VEQSDFEHWMDDHDDWDYTEDKNGLIILWQDGRSMSHVTWAAIADNDLTVLVAACKQGRDVDHITRVTGYFSKTSGWNKGKTAELKDRHRTPL